MSASGASPTFGLRKGDAHASLLLVVGADRDQAAPAARRVIGGSTDLWRLLGDEPFDELHLHRRSLREARPDLIPYRTILNLVTDADQNPEVLAVLGKLLRGYTGRIINRPQDVLQSTREKSAALLAGTPGLHVPRTIRLRGAKPQVAANAVARAGLTFPAILRLAGTHTGNIVAVVSSLEELQSKLVEGGDHIVTEFVDFRSADGLFRKYRVYFFGSRVVFRHKLITDHWNVHIREQVRFMTSRPLLRKEQAAMFDRPDGAFPAEVHATFERIRDRVPLDYFGFDFGIMPSGELVLFEANATMSFFPLFTDPRFAYIQRALAPAQEAFRAMVRGV